MNKKIMNRCFTNNYCTYSVFETESNYLTTGSKILEQRNFQHKIFAYDGINLYLNIRNSAYANIGHFQNKIQLFLIFFILTGEDLIFVPIIFSFLNFDIS